MKKTNKLQVEADLVRIDEMLAKYESDRPAVAATISAMKAQGKLFKKMLSDVTEAEERMDKLHIDKIEGAKKIIEHTDKVIDKLQEDLIKEKDKDKKKDIESNIAANKERRKRFVDRKAELEKTK